MLLAGTIRRDGAARISGVEPLVLDGDLWLSMMSGSAKVRDLGRDPRVVLNSVITSPSPPAELKVRGTAHVVTEQDRRERYAAAASVEAADPGLVTPGSAVEEGDDLG